MVIDFVGNDSIFKNGSSSLTSIESVKLRCVTQLGSRIKESLGHF